jgi:hypothetical protein
MRVVFIASGVLVVLAGVQVFLFPGRTDTGFAWTIRPPITAAALGGLYLAAVGLTLLSARERVWANARIFVPGTLVFATLILIATLLHFHRFHWHGPTAYAQFQATLWLVVYVSYPLILGAALIHQLRSAPGSDPPRQAPLPRWFRLVAGVQAAAFIGVGTALLVAPTQTADAIWPWELTPLTGRAIAAWLTALGVVLAHALLENDWIRIPAAPPTYTAVGVLQLVVVVRYADDLDWGGFEAWLYLLWFVSVTAVGLAAWMLARRARAALAAGSPPPLHALEGA